MNGQTILIILEGLFLHFPLVLGAYLVISLMKVPDLSLEAAYVSGAIWGAQALIITNHLPLPICFIISFIASIIGGSIVGVISSFFTQKARFPHLLSSILTMGLFHGINQYFLGTSNISISSKRNLLALIDLIPRHPELIQLALGFCFFVGIGGLFFCTQLGTSLAVYGNNPHFFKNYGISTPFIFISGIVISNSLSGIAGFFDALASGFVDINMGGMKALFCITSIILGKTLIRPKKPFSILVPILGTLFYFTIIQLLLKVNFNLKYFTAVQSAIVALILLIKSKQNSIHKTDHLGV